MSIGSFLVSDTNVDENLVGQDWTKLDKYQAIQKRNFKITFTVLDDVLTCFGAMLGRSNPSGNGLAVEFILAFILKKIIKFIHQHVSIYGFHQ